MLYNLFLVPCHVHSCHNMTNRPLEMKVRGLAPREHSLMGVQTVIRLGVTSNLYDFWTGIRAGCKTRLFDHLTFWT